MNIQNGNVCFNAMSHSRRFQSEGPGNGSTGSAVDTERTFSFTLYTFTLFYLKEVLCNFIR